MIKSVDLVISIAYILVILVIGLWVGVRHKIKNVNSYFLAGKTLRWPAIGLALFATNISTVHLVSLAQSGFDSGLLNGNFEWMAALTLILLALFFVPFYITSGVATLPDFLEKRYDRASRDWLVIISIVSAVIIHIAFSMLAGGVKYCLTRRQLELIRLVERGLTNKEIAANLNLSEFTVKNHLRRIMKEVDADDRHEAVDAIRASGLLPVV